MRKIAAVIVTYNRYALLEKCMHKVMAQTVPCTVFVVDNASTDETYQMMQKISDACINYIRLPENTGGAGGFFVGMKHAVEAGFDDVWIMDDDTLPEPNALEALVSAMEQQGGDVGWLSSKAVWTDGSLCAMNVQRLTPYRDLEVLQQAKPCFAQMASFVSLLVPADVIRKYGLPIASFFIWGDDWEFTRRISMRLPCFYVPTSIVVHAMQSNAPVNIGQDRMERMWRYKFAYRNDVVIYRREGIKGWFWVLMKYIWHSWQVIIKSKEGKLAKLTIIWCGFWEGCKFRPDIIYPRTIN